MITRAMLARLGFMLVTVAGALVAAAAPARAAIFSVNSTADAADASTGDGNCAAAGGQCTLRAAIQQANALGGTHTVNVPSGTYELTLGVITTSAETNNLTIAGTGPAGTVIIDGLSLAGVFRFFGGTITLNNLTIRNGSSGTTAEGACTGGGMFVGPNTTVIVNSSVITGNQAPNGTGGGICVGDKGTLNVTDSTVRSNTSTFGGGGIRVLPGGVALIVRSTINDNKATNGSGGGIENQGSLRLINSTVSGNSAATDRGPGGVSLEGGDGKESLRLTNVTIANNSGRGQLGASSGALIVESTIVAHPASTSNCVIEDQGSVTSNGHNIDSEDSCQFTTPSDRMNTDPLLGPLASNGGPTQSHALLTGSPAIDTGDPATCPATDQRGVARPQNGDGIGGALCDVGAYEVRGNAPLLLAAVLPASRSVQVGVPATAFATVINNGPGLATGCSISPVPQLGATFGYQTTDSTNKLIGTPNTPADIPAGAQQSFVFALTPSAPVASTDVAFTFACTNADPAPIVNGLDTLLFSASFQAVPDIVALAATVSGDGIVNLITAPPSVSAAASPVFAGAFAVAAVNVGIGNSITVSANTGKSSVPLILALCETDPATSFCKTSILPAITTEIKANATPTFAVFVISQQVIPFDPANTRVFVVFTGSDSVVRGATSVAAQTQ